MISHDKRLVQAEHATAEFVELLRILTEAKRIGPAFLQLPPFFSGEQLPVLESFLRRLPIDFRYAVEVRHPDYFDNGSVERRLDAMLTELNIDRVLFDSRPLFSVSAPDRYEKIAQSRKPKVPVRQTATGDYPMLRLVGRNDLQTVGSWIDEWCTVVAAWIREGRTPYVFVHSPNNELTPQFAELFHSKLSEQLPTLEPLPVWPGRQIKRQTPLF